MRLTFAAACALLGLAGVVHTRVLSPVSAQDSSLIGQWRTEYSFSDAATSVLQFDAREGGKGSFFSLDSRRSSLAPAFPKEAIWSETLSHVAFSGEIDVPIGNVGYESVKLSFEGAFESAMVISGEVTNVTEARRPDGAGQPKGTFTAHRISESKRPQQRKDRVDVR